MYEITKHEFAKWQSLLQKGELTKYEKTLLSQINSKFDEIAAVGTARGGRSKLLGEKIRELKNQTVDEITSLVEKEVDQDKIERIESLEVENFRGFGAVQKFEFKSRYTFFHGPNGSGKTSFCEALEYSVLGMIEEATARNIPIEKYILHAGQKKVQKPLMICKYSSGKERPCVPDYNEYRFGFIEKNRIEGFSHIGASSAKTQTERIAALFGLSEFQEFVKGFSNTIDEKYLSTTPVVQEQYKQALQTENNLKEQINTLKKEIIPIANELEVLIKKNGDGKISSYEETEKLLSDPEDGLIIRQIKECNENKKQIVESEDIIDLLKQIKSIISFLEDIQNSNSEILSDAKSINLSELYKAIIKVEKTDKCPACHTPLKNVVINPFENAKTELEKLKKIEDAKKIVEKNSVVVVQQFEDISKKISEIHKTGLFSAVDFNILDGKHLQTSEVEKMTLDVMSVYRELNKLASLLNNNEIVKTKIAEYNETARKNNKNYDDKLIEIQKLHKQLVTLNSNISAKNDAINKLKEQIQLGEEKIKELKNKADQEQQNIKFNMEMVTAYNGLVKRLDEYVLKLPIDMSSNLSEKVKNYYNKINDGDADFELIEELKLPIAPSEKIIIKMHDGIEQDALQILSEGHVKILGLAILLAKAVYEHSKFLIFDDIVNSVDDDHRDGVARLLITNPDFSDMQMILTCHGELFVSKLEDYVSNKKDMVRYMFLPADTLEERGIFIKYQDSSIPLETAREKYNEGNLKDSAAKCRQAVECITGKLWKKLSPYKKGGISVQIRSINNGPDLYNVTTALHKETQKGFEGMQEMHNDLGLLIDQSMWSVLNKGTHIDDTIPEFTRPEIKRLLELLEKLAKEVDDLKIKPNVVA